VKSGGETRQGNAANPPLRKQDPGGRGERPFLFNSAVRLKGSVRLGIAGSISQDECPPQGEFHGGNLEKTSALKRCGRCTGIVPPYKKKSQASKKPRCGCEKRRERKQNLGEGTDRVLGRWEGLGKISCRNARKELEGRLAKKPRKVLVGTASRKKTLLKTQRKVKWKFLEQIECTWSMGINKGGGFLKGAPDPSSRQERTYETGRQ